MIERNFRCIANAMLTPEGSLSKVYICYDVPSSHGKAIEIYSIDHVLLYSCNYQNTAERLLAARRAQKHCQLANLEIQEFADLMLFR